MDSCIVRLADTRTVLRRNPGARQNRLALREQERQLASCRLCRGKPLDCRGLWRCRITNDNRVGPSGKRNRQRRAHESVRRSHLEAERGALVVCNGLNLEITHVENHAVRASGSRDSERSRPRDSLRGEVRRQVQRDVSDPCFLRLSMRVNIARQGRKVRITC